MASTVLISILLALRTVSGYPDAREAVQADCLTYKPATVKLTGRIIRKVFPGPPEYTSIKAGDKPEPTYLLRLAKPICVKADPQDEDSVAVDKVTDLHLVVTSAKQFRQLRSCMGKRSVTLTGKLFHSFNGHHHTEVLMHLSPIKAL